MEDTAEHGFARDIIDRGETMNSKPPAIISAILTFIILLVLGALFFFVQIIALNGVMNEDQAFASLGVGLVCQGFVMLLAAGFAGWFSNVLIQRFDWNKVTSVFVAVTLGTLLGAVTAFISIAISIPLAGIR